MRQSDSVGQLQLLPISLSGLTSCCGVGGLSRQTFPYAYSAKLCHQGDSRVSLKICRDQREIWREELVCEEKWAHDRWSDVAHDIRLEMTLDGLFLE